MKPSANPFAATFSSIFNTAAHGHVAKGCRPAVRLCGLLSGALALVGGPRAMGASQTWDGGSSGSGSNGNWGTVANWDGAIPGSTAITTNTDVATFGAAILNTWGDAVGNPVVIDANRNIGGISFTLQSGNYFIGAAVGNALKLTSGGAIQILAGLTATNAAETINAPLAIQLANGTYTFANDSANGTGVGAGTLNFGGGITGAVAGATVLNLYGSNTNANTISGIIGNGTATSLAVTKAGTGTWVLSGNNIYTGPTTINAGTLSASTIVAGGSLGNATSPVTLGSGSTKGTLSYTGSTADYARGLTIGGHLGVLNVTTAGQTLTVSSGSVTGTGMFTVGGAGNTTITSNLTHNGSLAKADTGTLTLSGTGNAYANTYVNAGTLIVGAGSSTGTGTVTVAKSGTLGGTGAINGALTVEREGTHSPGDSPGTQNVKGTATYQAGSIFVWDIVDGTGADLGTYDKVAATGLLGGSGAFFNIINSGGFTTSFWDANKSWTDIFTVPPGSTALDVIFAGGFGGSVPANGIVAGEGSFAFTGNTLNWTAVPEPTTALAGLLIMGGLLRRRR